MLGSLLVSQVWYPWAFGQASLRNGPLPEAATRQKSAAASAMVIARLAIIFLLALKCDKAGPLDGALSLTERGVSAVVDE